jgi:hypothetical protein
MWPSFYGAHQNVIFLPRLVDVSLQKTLRWNTGMNRIYTLSCGSGNSIKKAAGVIYHSEAAARVSEYVILRSGTRRRIS